MTEHPSVGPAVVHAAALSTNVALASARAELHDAVRAADDEHRRRQHALCARDSAAAVLLDTASTRLECDYARNYFSDATAMIAKALDTFMCEPHTNMLAPPLRHAVRDSYEPGQTPTANPYLTAAIDAVRHKEKRTKPAHEPRKPIAAGAVAALSGFLDGRRLDRHT